MTEFSESVDSTLFGISNFGNSILFRNSPACAKPLRRRQGLRASRLFLLGFLVFPIPKEVLQLVHEFLGIFELTINRGETDISDAI